jgi:hypothetical protein
MAVGTRHRFAPLKRAFYYQKGTHKRLNGACFTALRKHIKALWWSDPNRDLSWVCRTFNTFHVRKSSQSDESHCSVSRGWRMGVTALRT